MYISYVSFKDSVSKLGGDWAGSDHRVSFKGGVSRSDGSWAGSAHKEEALVVEEVVVVESWLGVVGVAAMKVGVCSWC